MNHLTLEELSARLDVALSGAALDRAERHLAECAQCREALAALAGQDALLRPALEHDPGESYFESFAGRVEDRIRAAGLRGAQARLGEGWLGWLRSPRRLAWAGAAAAMVVGVAVVLVMARVERPALKPELSTRLEQRESTPLTSAAPPADVARDQELEGDLGQPPAAALGNQQKDDDQAAPEALAKKGSVAGRTAPSSRLTETRRSDAGEDVPVRSNVAPAPAAEADQQAATAAKNGEIRIVKPGAAQPMAERSAGLAAGAEDVKLQPAEETRLCGRVLDPKGQPVAGAVVALADLGRTAKTDASGRFCLSAPAGTHDLTAMAVGYGSSRMQVRAEGQTTDALVTLNPVSVLDRAGARDGRGLVFSQEPGGAFMEVSERMQVRVRAAQRAASQARSATQFDAAATAWQRVVDAVPRDGARTEALFRTAETRFRAWQLGPTTRRAQMALAALGAFLEVAPEDDRRKQAERWRDQVRP